MTNRTRRSSAPWRRSRDPSWGADPPGHQHPIHLVAGSALVKRLSEEHGLLGRPDRPLISIVTVGECLAMATRLGWGEAKQGALRNLLAELVILDLRHPGVVGKYAEIASHCVEHGIGAGQNDLWIAATASATGAWLLMTDKDFLPLSPQHLHLELAENHP